jgi:hypothetical protein
MLRESGPGQQNNFDRIYDVFRNGIGLLCPGDGNMNKIETVFSEVLFKVYRKQMTLLDNLGTGNWRIDLPNHTLTLSNGAGWKFQVLGLETDSGVWMWAWADEGHLNPASTVLAKDIKTSGTKLSLPEFTKPKLSTADLLCGGHTLAAISSSFYEKFPYFAGPQGDINLFILINDPAYPSKAPGLSPQEFSDLFSQMVADYMIADQQLALTSALNAENYAISTTDTGIIATRHDGKIQSVFDESDRISELKAG